MRQPGHDHVHEDDLGSIAEARRDLVHAALDQLLTHADELTRLNVGALMAGQLAEAAEEDGCDDAALLVSLATMASDAVTRQSDSVAELEHRFADLVRSLTTDGLEGGVDGLDQASDAFADASDEAGVRRAESATVLRAIGRLAVGSGATSDESGEAAADLWDLGLELLALTALEDPASCPDDDDSGRLAVLDDRRLLRDLTGLVAQVAVNAPAALALQVGVPPANPTEVTVRHLHHEVVVGVQPVPYGLHAPDLRAEGDSLVARLDPDEAPPDVAALVADVLRDLGVAPGRDLAFLVVRLEAERVVAG